MILKILGSVAKGIISTKIKGAKTQAKEYVGLTEKGTTDKALLISNIAKWVIIGILLILVATGKIDESLVKSILNKFIFL